MARWLSFFAEYNFQVEYKPGRLNVIADALSRRPDYDPKGPQDETAVHTMHSSTVKSPLATQVARAYKLDEECQALMKFLSRPTDEAARKLPGHLRSRVHRYSLRDGMLYFSTSGPDNQRIVVPDNEELKQGIMFEFHDVSTAGHLGREKTFLSLARVFNWPHQYKWVRKYVRTCEICQRVKPSPSSQAPLQSLHVATNCWKSISMDFVFGLPPGTGRKTGILVFVDRISKMVHLTAVSANITAAQTARVFVDTVFRLHRMPDEIILDRDPRFTARFWTETFALLGTRLNMSTSDHPETDGQTERVNRVLGNILRSYAHTFTQWSDYLPMAEFAINNSVHALTGLTPFFASTMRRPRLPSAIDGGSYALVDNYSFSRVGAAADTDTYNGYESATIRPIIVGAQPNCCGTLVTPTSI